MTITVFLADDHTILRDGLRFLLEAQPGIRVVGDAADGRSAVQQAAQLCPDVVIMDIAMPELNGIEATRQLRAACPAVKVIILSIHSTADHVAAALEAGARGYLLKESAGAEVVSAVRTVATGRRFLSRQVAEQWGSKYPTQEEALPPSPLLRLSAREREVLQLVVEGKTSVQIGQILSLSPKTVETYRSRIMAKLGIPDIPNLVKFAIRHGLTTWD